MAEVIRAPLDRGIGGQNKLSGLGKLAIYGLAISQIVIGLVCLCLEVAIAVTYNGQWTWVYTAPGIWSGVLVVAVGTVGMVTAQLNNRHVILAYLAMNVIAAVDMPVFIFFSGVNVVEALLSNPVKTAAAVLDILNVILAFLQGIMAVTAARLCGRLTCCPKKSKRRYDQLGQPFVVTDGATLTKQTVYSVSQQSMEMKDWPKLSSRESAENDRVQEDTPSKSQQGASQRED